MSGHLSACFSCRLCYLYRQCAFYLKTDSGVGMTGKKKMGRPSIYGFDLIQVGGEWSMGGADAQLEKIRRAAYSFAQKTGRSFRTTKLAGKIHVQRVA